MSELRPKTILESIEAQQIKGVLKTKQFITVSVTTVNNITEVTTTISSVNPDKCVVVINGIAGQNSNGSISPRLETLTSTSIKISLSLSASATWFSNGSRISIQIIEFY